MRITPSEFQFQETKVGYVSKLRLINLRSRPVGFKLKTNRPRKFLVKPVVGVLLNKGDSIEVTVKSSEPITDNARFLIQTALLSQDEASRLDSTYWKSLDEERIMEDIVGCKIVAIPSPQYVDMPVEPSYMYTQTASSQFVPSSMAAPLLTGISSNRFLVSDIGPRRIAYFCAAFMLISFGYPLIRFCFP
ncbi:hypothetical protein EV182_001821 [Spiromyces aspiralis]|uniref:Uncharacterized protein n=1 Tax=Spiromyces aspiralis TaxID=68401 RepID=A0ACC1HUY4_9FUNG|nr:hypothetical protein EV182_001821 [Spiromyces aspiralis]